MKESEVAQPIHCSQAVAVTAKVDWQRS